MRRQEAIVVRLQKASDWIHALHAWHLPLLAVPGIVITGVSNGEVKIERDKYKIDYKEYLLRGAGVQHDETLYVTLALTKKISPFWLVLLTAGMGAAGMLLLFFILPALQGKALSHPVLQNKLAFRKSTAYPASVPAAGLAGRQVKKAVQARPETAVTAPSVFISNYPEKNDPSRPELILLLGEIPDSAGIGGEATRADRYTAPDIAGVLQKRGTRVYASFFSEAVFRSPVFSRMLLGEWSSVPLAVLHEYADELGIGTVYRKVRPSLTQKNMYTAEIALDLQFISTADGQVLRHFEKQFSQAGFSPEQALAQANKTMNRILNDQL